MINVTGNYPYPSRRNAVYGGRGMVATSHPLAAEAGMAVFRKGGNAIDAAVAAAAALSVVDPMSTGPGGDLFAIVYANGELHGLNASGHSAGAMTLEALKERGYSHVPGTGWLSVTVPGGPAGWAALCKRFGKLPMPDTFAPAVELAQGHPVSGGYASCTNRYIKEFGEKNKKEDGIYSPWFDAFAPEGKSLNIGDMVSLKDLGAALAEIAATEAESFYRGTLAKAITDYARRTGGLLDYEDFESYQCEWVQPISANYRGYDLWELPPNCQGITPLIALNIMEGFTPHSREDVQTVHRQIESMKLAFADAYAYIADPNHAKVDVSALISKDYAAKRRDLITEEAQIPRAGEPYKGGTVYLCAADGEGNMISLIQSVAMSYGSGVVVPGTGLLLQNRGSNFSSKPGHPNFIGPRKRPYNTIIPGFITKDSHPIGPMGVMGGYMQPQGHMQVLMNMVDFGMNPQSALDAPRWSWQKDKHVSMEVSWSKAVLEALQARGHELNITNDGNYGRGAVIVRMENGVLCGGTEPRSDGAIAAF